LLFQPSKSPVTIRVPQPAVHNNPQFMLGKRKSDPPANRGFSTRRRLVHYTLFSSWRKFSVVKPCQVRKI
ncbi:MAG: hypothetical protein ACK55Z_29365, partial [bacterium]